MLIIPAIDVKDGKCVRLIQGRMQEETVYSDDPEAVALRWAGAGARLLHVVDLDAAVQGSLRNRGCIARVIRAAGVPVQVGGGLRDLRAVDACVELGAFRVIVGTAAVQELNFVRSICRLHPGRIVAGIDARQGRVATHGWTRTTAIQAVDLARQMEDAGVAALIFTDIHRDGMQTGPNIEETWRLAEAVRIPVIASGGVGTLDHIRALLPLEAVGVIGVITGKALYSGLIRFEEAVALTRTGSDTEDTQGIFLDKNEHKN
ncbi:MAG: 1-(5-phosphoribosyl)-5-[(5-phosphoribosylamino)methylideneamino]imidazole-4-carboxamide isomerase [Hyphomicrobiales bacterium]